MKNCLYIVLISFFWLASENNSFAQQAKAASSDTTKKNKPVPKKDTLIETGIAVSPSTLRFNVKPGTLQTKTVKVTNDTKRKQIFQVLFQDYGPDKEGKGQASKSKYDMYSLSKYIVVNPTLIELNPRQQKTVTVTVDIPPGDSMAISMWTIMEIDQVIDREKLEIPNLSSNTVGMGVKNSFGFAINIYQNPPNVTVSNVEFTELKFIKKTEKKGNSIFVNTQNKGSGIAYCLFFVELTNLVTGKLTKLKVKQFAIFPGFKQDFTYELPSDLEKGPYSVMTVLDFGDKEELQTAELEFTVE